MLEAEVAPRMSFGCTSHGRRTFLKTTMAAGTAVGLAGLAGPVAAQRDHFRIGVVTSLSGDLRFGGHVTRRGYDLWERTINDQGGIEVGDERYEVALEYGDARSEPGTGADVAVRLIEGEDVDVLLGPYSSPVTLAVAPITDREEVPHITGSAESPDIWLEQYEYTFGTIPTVTIIAGEVTEGLLQLEPEADSAYITGVEDPFTRDAAEAMRDTAEEVGIEVLGYELFPAGSDWTSPVSAAAAEDPDFHMHGAHIADNVDFTTAAADLDYTPNGIFQHYGVETDSYHDGAGDLAEYIFGASVWLPGIDRPGGPLFDSPEAYAEESQVHFETVPDYTQAASTAAGIVYQEALGELGSEPPLTGDDRAELIGILEEISVETFYGTVEFETEGEFYHNNIATDPIGIQLREDLAPEIVTPEDLQTVEPEYPVPPWDER